MTVKGNKVLLWSGIGLMWALVVVLASLLLLAPEGGNTSSSARASLFHKVSAGTEQEDTGLLFYDKKTFMGYFKDQYSADELENAYRHSADSTKKAVRVLANKARGSGHSFGNSFEIRPVDE
jgi:hypothetical protein